MKAFPFPSARVRALLVAGLIGLLPVLSGMLVLRWQVNRTLDFQAQHVAGEAVRQLDAMIDQAAQSARRLMPLAGKPCTAAVVQAILQEVTIEPYVRSANLVRNHDAYCSSFYGAYKRAVEPGEYFNRHLLLRASNPVTPDEASLVYRLYEHPLGVRTVIDGRTLAEALRLIQGDTVLMMQVGNAFLWGDSSIQDGEIPDHPAHHTLLVSERHGYRVHSGFSAQKAWELWRIQGLSTLGGLLLLGVLTGGVCHWLLRRQQRP